MPWHLPAVGLLAVTAVWGWTFVVVGEAVAAWAVVPFLAVRFLVATLALLPIWGRRLDRGTIIAGSAIGLLLAAGYLLQTAGLTLTTPTNAGLITGLFVVVAPVASRLLYGTHLRLTTWLAVALSVAGMVLLAGGGSFRPSPGDLLILACALAFGVHIAVLSRHAPRFEAGPLTVAQMGATAIVFLLAWPAAAGPVALPPADVWPAIAVTGVLASAAAYAIQTWAQRSLSAARTAVILTAEPLFAAAFGYVLAGDRLTAVQLVGGGLIMAALALAEIVPALGSRRTRAA